MTQRYYFSSAVPENGRVRLEDDEARHLVKVMRKKIGETVQIFNGSGRDYLAEIVGLLRNAVELLIREPLEPEPPPGVELVIATALPKGDRQKWLVEKLTELGCARLVPLAVEHGVAKAERNVLERLRRTVIEASKQCGRSRFMQISEETTIQRLSEAIDQEDSSPSAARLIAHPMQDENVSQIPLFDWAVRNREQPRVFVLIGPEGGFSPDEVQAAIRRHWQPVDLGRTILRTETASVAVAALLLGK